MDYLRYKKISTYLSSSTSFFRRVTSVRCKVFKIWICSAKAWSSSLTLISAAFTTIRETRVMKLAHLIMHFMVAMLARSWCGSEKRTRRALSSARGQDTNGCDAGKYPVIRVGAHTLGDRGGTPLTPAAAAGLSRTPQMCSTVVPKSDTL